MKEEERRKEEKIRQMWGTKATLNGSQSAWEWEGNTRLRKTLARE